ncbi:hypothetical protein L2E82_33689 [Cichorium intybus]|uniref:Uncharacterized protein n=1 Tax=Cichorium intybus TaxID=13427 RepID=A0ACB9BKZ4_CICIN|nr:hypothetical protein L2E82_33689 [Cichorium intybus]
MIDLIFINNHLQKNYKNRFQFLQTNIKQKSADSSSVCKLRDHKSEEIGTMEISLLKALLKNISSFFQLSPLDSGCCELVEKYYITINELLKLIKPTLESIIDTPVASDEQLQKELADMNQSVDELKELFEECHPLMSKVYFVLKAESLFTKVQTHCLDIFDLLQSSSEQLPFELNSSSLEKIKHMGYEKPSAIVSKAIREQVEGSDPNSDTRSKIADLLSLKTNQELLIEAVALETLKENAEQAEKIQDLEYIEEMIALITHMHDCFVEVKQSESCTPVPIPPDFCCPLSLELMTDPVIVASGQTYERGYIRNWIDLGLNVCPKTMQTLVHSNLIPNYTVKALIANWCESNNVKLPDPVKNHPSSPKSNGIHQEEASSPVNHVRSSSEDSGKGNEFNENDRKDESGEKSLDSVGPSGVDEGSPEVPVNESSSSTPATAYNSDASGELAVENPPAVTIAPQASPRYGNRSRNQIWRRSSFGPRVVSSVNETRPDLTELETQVKKLVNDLSSTSIDTVTNATGELRLLARHNMDNRIVIANCGAITLLIGLLYSPDQKVQENSVTALLNLSINDINKAAIANANAIEPLIHVLETGSSEARENSAATLFSLSVIEDNKIRIGRSGAIGPLVDLLGNGTPRGKKDAATALFNLSIFHENKARIVQAGAVKYLVELMDPAGGMVDKAVAVLSNLATLPEGRAAIGQEGGIPMLVEVVELGSARGKENAAAALLQLCTNSGRFCNIVLQEGAVPPLVALSQSGTPRAKEKAQSLLSFFRNQRHGNGGRG